MDRVIETSIATKDGIADCRIELQENDTYHITILYPNLVNGFSRSEIFCYDMRKKDDAEGYEFIYEEEGIHPKILKMEAEISAEITK